MMARDEDREIREAVADLLLRYATGIDRRDWSLFRTCFTDDCEADYGEFGRWHGADAITSWMEETHAACGHTLHRITNQVVSHEADIAAARSYVDAVIMGPDSPSGTRAIGYYDDEFRHGADGWQIARRTFTMVLSEPVSGHRRPVADDVEAIRQLKARYFRTIDTKDWDGLKEVFTTDAVIDMTATGGGITSGATEFVTFLEGAIGDVVTVHHGHMPEIDITSATTAQGIWAMEDMLRWPTGTELHGYGHYHETYVKDDAGWRIKTSRLARIRMDMTEPVRD